MYNRELLEKIQLVRDLTKQLDYMKESPSEKYMMDLIDTIIFKIDATNGEILQEIIDNNELGFITVDLDSLEEWIKKTDV